MSDNERTFNANWFRAHPMTTVLLSLLLLLTLIILWLWLKPFSVSAAAEPNPATSYEDAIARITAIQQAEEQRGDLNLVCHSQLLTHGEKTEQTILFLHGFTSCPDQFLALGQEFFDLGYNVYIPRVPHHGISDLMTEELKQLTAEEMAAFGTEVADIAQGLGENVSVAGLSGGGTMAAWLAQEREDVELAAPIAPFIGVGFIPTALNKPFTNALLLLPNIWMWWDPQTRENNPLSAPYSYRRYPTRALAEVMRLGFATEAVAAGEQPLSSNIVMISNAADRSVNNSIIDRLVGKWRTQASERVHAFQFEATLGLPHDIITTTRPEAQIDVVYPVLLDLLLPAQE